MSNSIFSSHPKKAFSLFNIRYLNLFLLLLFALFLVSLSLRNINSSDIGFQLKIGEMIVHGQGVPQTDPFTFGAADHPYICLNTLFSVLGYLLVHFFGWNSMSLYLVITVFILATIFYWRFRQEKIALPIWLPLTILAFLIFDIRLWPNGQQLAFIFILAEIWLGDTFLRTKNIKYLYWWPLLQLLWTNSHATFMLGWLVIGSYCLTWFFQQKKLDWRLIGVGMISALVSLCNPYTWRGALWPFTSFSWFQKNNLFNTHQVEYSSISSILNGDFMTTAAMQRNVVLFLLFTIIVFLTYLYHRRQLQIHHWLCACMLFLLSWLSNRVIPFFILTTLLPTLILINRDWQHFSWPKIKKFLLSHRINLFSSPKTLSSHLLKKRLLIGDYLFCTFLLLYLNYQFISGHYYGSAQSALSIGLATNVQPVAASQFLAEHHLTGNILNSHYLGGWLIWSLPNKIYINAHLEVMGENLYQEYQQIDTKKNLAQILKKYNVEIIMIENQFFNIIAQVNQLSDWRPVYLDDVVVIFLRQDIAPELSTYDLSSFYQSHHLSRQLSLLQQETLLDSTRPLLPPTKNLADTHYGFHPNFIYSQDSYLLDMVNLLLLFDDSEQALPLLLNYLNRQTHLHRPAYLLWWNLLFFHQLQTPDSNTAAFLTKLEDFLIQEKFVSQKTLNQEKLNLRAASTSAVLQ